MNKEYNKDYININTKDDLDYLVNRIRKGPIFAEAFKFKPYELKDQFLSDIGLSSDVFNENYFYYNNEEKLHISESSQGYIWISTMGLVAQGGYIDTINNQFVNSCRSQYIVLCLLLDKAISLCEDEKLYDIDGNSYEYLNKMTPALFHNIIFYLELFGKAYLSINKVKFPKTHRLSEIFRNVRKTMFKLSQNDTLFHALILSPFEDIVKYINTIPGNFKEENIKYEDNMEDSTVIRFSRNELNNTRNTINISYDFIIDFYYNKESGDALYLKQGLYNRLLEKAKSDEDKQKVINTYQFLLNM